MRSGYRMWTTVFLLAASLAGAAQASIRASGFHVDGVGPSILTASPDGEGFHLSNIDASGSCGVTIQLAGLEGHVIVAGTPWDGSDAGAALSYNWSILSKPAGSHAQLSLTRSSGGTQVHLSNPFTTSPTMT